MFSGLWYLSLSGQTVSSLVLSIGRLQPLHGQVICILAFAGHVLCPDYWALPYWGEAATGDMWVSELGSVPEKSSRDWACRR